MDGVATGVFVLVAVAGGVFGKAGVFTAVGDAIAGDADAGGVSVAEAGEKVGFGFAI